jgi:hypothetical protein
MISRWSELVKLSSTEASSTRSLFVAHLKLPEDSPLLHIVECKDWKEKRRVVKETKRSTRFEVCEEQGP